MAAGDFILGVRAAINALAAATHVSLAPTTVVRRITPPSAGVLGPMGSLIVYKDLAVTIYGNDRAELLALVGTKVASLAIPIYGLDGAASTITITNVYFNEVVGEFEFPARDSGGKVPQFAVKGHVLWGEDEEWDDVLSVA
jgi:hypothetical protein